MSARTVREFTVSTDVWPIVEAWARDSKYDLKGRIESARLYQRSLRFGMLPMMLQISQEADEVHIEAWLQADFVERLATLFLFPSEMGIESGGFMWSSPRGRMRSAVNELLRQLGQPPIE